VRPGRKPKSPREGSQALQALLGAVSATRRALGRSQTDVARALGIDQSVVARIERGAFRPTIGNFLAYAAAAGAELTVTPNLTLEPGPWVRKGPRKREGT